MPIKINKEINLYQMILIGLIVISSIGGYFKLSFNVDAQAERHTETKKEQNLKITKLQVEKLDESLYEKDMEILDRLVDGFDKLADQITKLQIEIAGWGK